jgi:hypothetical protein
MTTIIFFAYVMITSFLSAWEIAQLKRRIEELEKRGKK